MLIQLNDLIPVTTPLGKGYAILVESLGHDYWWTVALASGAIVTFTQDRIRIANSYSHRRGINDRAMRRITGTLPKVNKRS